MADDSKTTDVGARYAQALFDLAKDSDSITAIEADLKTLKAMLAESADLRRLLPSPKHQRLRATLAFVIAGPKTDRIDVSPIFLALGMDFGVAVDLRR